MDFGAIFYQVYLWFQAFLMNTRLRDIWSWFQPTVPRIRRRSRRLASITKTIGRIRRRTRFSTTSTYYTSEENNTEWIVDRESAANPANHSDTFLEPFRPWKIDCISELSPISQSIKQAHAFNSKDCSPNIYIVENDCLTMHRLPIAQSTDAIRGKMGYEKGMHIWRIHWPTGQRGTNAVVGVATKNHPLRSGGYTSLLGSVEGGYGWDISKNLCYNNGKEKDAWTYPDPTLIEDYSIPADIFCILDMDDGYLAFSTMDRYLGIAFRGLKGQTLYPAISAVWGHCEVTMEYLGAIHRVSPLTEICRRQIRDVFLRDDQYLAEELPLPEKLKQYVVSRPRESLAPET